MKPVIKGAMHSKTMWFSLAMVVFGSIYENLPAVQSIIDPKYYGVMLIAIGVICAVLRFVTTQPLEDR